MIVRDEPRPGLYRNRTRPLNSIDTLVDQRTWQQLAETAEPIGECRGLQPIITAKGKTVHVPCDGVMFAEPVSEHQNPEDPIWWQEARCNACGATVASPNRRALNRSTRRGEMPSGYWEDRMRRLRPTEVDT